MIALFCRIGFLDGHKNRKTKEHVSMPAGPEAKESPGFFDLMAFSSEVLIFFALWFSADSRPQKLNSDKFDQWRIRRRMWRNMYICTSSRSFSHKVRTRRFGRSILPSRRAPDRRQRSAGRYIYLYVYRDRKPSQHVTVGLAWGSPQLCRFVPPHPPPPLSPDLNLLTIPSENDHHLMAFCSLPPRSPRLLTFSL